MIAKTVTKIKVIEGKLPNEFEEQVNRFIEDLNVLDIQTNTVVTYNQYIKYIAYITYEVNVAELTPYVIPE